MEDIIIGTFLFAEEICPRDLNLYMTTKPQVKSLFSNILLD